MPKTSRKSHAQLFIVAFVALLLQSATLVTYHALSGQVMPVSGPTMQSMSAPATMPLPMMPGIPMPQRGMQRPVAGMPQMTQQMQRPAAGGVPGMRPMQGVQQGVMRDPCPLIKIMEAHFQQMMQMCQTQAPQAVQQAQ